MTTDTGEAFRGGVHAVTASLVAAMALYNLMELARRRERHLAVNVAVYAPLWGFELYQTWRHWAR